MDVNTDADDSYVNTDADKDMSYTDLVNSDGSDSDGSHSDGSDTNQDEDNNDDDKAANLNISADDYGSVMNLSGDDIRGMEFGSEPDAYRFYFAYAKCNGFGVRKDDVRRDSYRNLVMRQFVCNKAGLREKKHFMRTDRKKEHRPLTRTKCPAKLRVYLDYKTQKWKVSSFREEHNHELTPAKFVPLIPTYRGLSAADKAQINALHSHGIRTCQIMGFLMDQKSGYAKMGFSKKDVSNYIESLKRGKIKDGDAMAALSYLQGKADNDPMFFSHYICTKDGRLKNLFWADGTSRADYHCFGDVIAFDATYKKNKYNNPLIIFSGKNHHSGTVIFACALVGDETVETYKWVLETFLICMCSKHPTAVVTDGDGSMREAIRQVFPNAAHRLCAWHLNKNASENVKNVKFLKDFAIAMYSNFTVEQFESYWEEMVAEHGLQGNKWVEKTYERRSLWATAYLRDKFFARIRTTSQCEGVNSLIKAYVRSKNSIIEFLHHFEQSVRQYRYNELTADYTSCFTEPVLTTSLKKIEHHASKIFTLNIFKEVRCEIDKAGTFNVIERSHDGGKVMFKLNEWCKPRSERHVVYDEAENKFLCDCKLFECCGIPCAHIFCVMRLQHIDSIPATLICNRWKKDAKSDIVSSHDFDGVDADMMEVSRFVELVGIANSLCELAVKKREHFNETRSILVKLIGKLQSNGTGRTNDVDVDGVKFVNDPIVVKSKGAPVKKKNSRKRKRCSNCNRTGHIIRTCPRALGTEDKHNRQDDSSSAESEDSRRSTDSNNEDLSSQFQCGSSNGQKEKSRSKRTMEKKVDKKVCLSQSSAKETKEKSGSKRSTEKKVDKKACLSQSSIKEIVSKEIDVKSPLPSMVPPAPPSVPPFQTGPYDPTAPGVTNVANRINMAPPIHGNPAQNAFGTFGQGVPIVPPVHHGTIPPFRTTYEGFGQGVGAYHGLNNVVPIHPVYGILQRPYFHGGVGHVFGQGLNNGAGNWNDFLQQVIQNGFGTGGKDEERQ